MALVLAVGKAFTLTIWRTLPKPRPGLRQEMLQAWKNRRLRKQAATSPVQHRRSEQAVDESSRSAEEVKDETHAAAPTLQHGSVTQPRSSTPAEN
jgi:tripartite-type tricarboxylate transporter receptor subunit TctC